MKTFNEKVKYFFRGGPKLKPYDPNKPTGKINETQVLIERIIMALLLVLLYFIF